MDYEMPSAEGRLVGFLWGVTRLNIQDLDDMRFVLSTVYGPAEKNHKKFPDIDQLLLLLYGEDWKDMKREELKARSRTYVERIGYASDEVRNCLDPLLPGVAQLVPSDLGKFERILAKIGILNGDTQPLTLNDVHFQTALITEEEEKRMLISTQLAAFDSFRREARAREVRELDAVYSKNFRQLNMEEHISLALDLDYERLKSAAIYRQRKLLAESKEKIMNDYNDYVDATGPGE
jgi:hypothetical protein